MSEKPSILKRFLLSIPWYRHRAAQRMIKDERKRDEMVDLCNRTIMYKIAPQLATLVTNGKIDESVFESIDYFKDIITKLFGKRAESFAANMKLERVLHKTPGISIRLLIIPSSEEVGQSQMIAFVYGNGHQALAFSLEYSINKNLCVCEWIDGKHINYGTVPDKREFVKKVIRLFIGENSEKPDLSKLDLKHRLADEIGVRFEKLDSYMQKFQSMVYDEMSGVDTSGIPSDIDDVDEWMRYVNWEIKQAKSRMSDEELMQAQSLFEMMKNRDNVLDEEKWN